MIHLSETDIPLDWTNDSIENGCIKVTSGGTPSRKNKNFYFDGVIPWVKTKELEDSYIWETEESITYDAINNSSAKILPSGTVLLAMYGATVGMLGITRGKMACNQACCALITDSETLDKDFLFYFLLSNRKNLVNLATGAAQQNISGALIKEIAVPRPDLLEQRKIGAVLRTLDDKIELNQKMNQTLEDIAKAIFKSWFVDFGPVRAKMEGRPTGLPPEIDELFPDELVDSEIGEIPKGWELKTIQDVAKVTSGKRPPEKENVQNERCQYFVYGGAGPMAFCSEPLNFTKPAIITGRVGTLGKVFYLTDDCWVSDNSILICDAGVYSPLVFYTLQSIDLTTLNVGSTQPLVTGKDIKNLSFVAPSDSLLHEYKELFDFIKNRQSTANAEIEVLTELRDTLLPKLISGELRIPDAEKFLEEAGI